MMKHSPRHRGRIPAVAVVTMGCSKNEVDSETMLGLLSRRGWRVQDAIRDADLVILNTCAFIRAASEESAEVLAELVDLKRGGRIGHLIVAGCLPQKHRTEELLEAAPDVDFFIGVGDLERVAAAVEASLAGQRKSLLADPEARRLGLLPRMTFGPSHSRYVKISEGCSNGCAYCLIPRLRGPHRSRRMATILREIDALTPLGPIAEINLIGQDTSSYGQDLYGRARLPELLRRISAQGRAKWIRVLYAHPAHVTDELIGALADMPAVCRYIDLPMQHASDPVLKRMGRRTTRRRMERHARFKCSRSRHRGGVVR